jgi:hypothetical protein
MKSTAAKGPLFEKATGLIELVREKLYFITPVVVSQSWAWFY